MFSILLFIATMQLSEKVLKIQQRADKTLSFGCMFNYNYDRDDNDVLTFCSIYDDTGDTKTLSYLCPSKERTHEIDGEYIDELVII